MVAMRSGDNPAAEHDEDVILRSTLVLSVVSDSTLVTPPTMRTVAYMSKLFKMARDEHSTHEWT